MAKYMANRKVEEMKAIEKVKAKRERERLEPKRWRQATALWHGHQLHLHVVLTSNRTNHLHSRKFTKKGSHFHRWSCNVRSPSQSPQVVQHTLRSFFRNILCQS